MSFWSAGFWSGGFWSPDFWAEISEAIEGRVVLRLNSRATTVIELDSYIGL